MENASKKKRGECDHSGDLAMLTEYASDTVYLV